MLKILIAMDESPQSLAAARCVAALAERGARVEAVLLNVQPPIRSGEIGAIATLEDANARRVRASAAILGPACQALRRAAVQFVEHGMTGDPAAVIGSTAVSLGCDAIFVGSRARRPLAQFITGSVSHELLRATELPITLVPTDKGRTLADPLGILVPVDGSELAERVLRHAMRLAQAIPRTHLHLLHVEPALTAGGVLTASREALVEHWSGARSHAVLDPLAAQLAAAGCEHTIHIAHGEPGARIRSLSDTLRCDWIVMGTRGLGRLASVVLGSAAREVVHGARIPVTLVC